MKPIARRYQVVSVPEELHQLIETGGTLICPAVVAVCGPSINPAHSGKFWWKVAGAQETNYVESLEEAKTAIAAALPIPVDASEQ